MVCLPENSCNSEHFGKIPANFMDLLRGLLQESPQVAFAFAGLHTLDEMTADYFHPFFGSVINN